MEQLQLSDVIGGCVKWFVTLGEGLAVSYKVKHMTQRFHSQVYTLQMCEPVLIKSQTQCSSSAAPV